MRYRKKPVKKPVVIEAVQYVNDQSIPEILNFIGKPGMILPRIVHPSIPIDTLEGTMHANVGDWLIKGVAGEFYPCKPDIFAATYEEVE